MKVAIAKIKGIAPYSQSRIIDPEKCPKLNKESNDDYAQRTWREHLHTDSVGNVVIPPMAFKNCVSEAAKYLSMQIPGKGKSTYTKHFEAGVQVVEPSVLAIKADKVGFERLFLPSDGQRGSGKRVWKYYPVIPEWETEVTFYIFDDTITKDVFVKHLIESGRFIGIGRFRPRNNGFYGRFTVEKIEWSESE